PLSGAPPGKNEALVSALKKIVALAKRGSSEEAYREYAALFSSQVFADYRPEDQRQALKLMIMAKTPNPVHDAVLVAHRAALPRLKAIVEKLDDPADYELLGICQVMLNDAQAAKATFETALAVERARNPSSELVGSVMRRISTL